MEERLALRKQASIEPNKTRFLEISEGGATVTRQHPIPIEVKHKCESDDAMNPEQESVNAQILRPTERPQRLTIKTTAGDGQVVE